MSREPGGIQTFLAIAACKASRAVIRKVGRGGTNFPGKLALKICRNLLSVTSRGMEIVIVTGTNGKTTACRMLSHAMEEKGLSVLANRSGANLLAGVTAEFACAASLSGKPGKHYAVIESDEAALKQIVPLVHPKAIVVTNLFRDQLDRYGEVTHTRDQIRLGIEKAPDAVLCLDADDSLVSSLSWDVPNRILWYGSDIPIGSQKDVEISDAKYCLRCGTEYRYHYHTYAHLGAFYCPKCGYERHEADVALTGLSEMTSQGSQVSLRVQEKEYPVRIGLPAVYNVYNALAAVTGFLAMGFSPEEILPTLSDIHSSFGRMETFDLSGVPVQMILVKNPAGCNQAMEYLRALSEEMTVVFCLNDRTQDGHDISWIWDADYERLVDPEENPHVKEIIVSGDRAEDMALRLKYADAPTDSIRAVKGNGALLEEIKKSARPVYILPNYTAMLSLRKALSDATGGQEFWK